MKMYDWQCDSKEVFLFRERNLSNCEMKAEHIHYQT
jgi:hypothetical protein